MDDMGMNPQLREPSRIKELKAALVTATKLMERATQQLGTTQAVADYHDSLDEMKVWLDKQAKEDE